MAASSSFSETSGLRPEQGQTRAAKGGLARFFTQRSPASLRPAGTRVRPNLHTISWFGLCCTMGYAGAVQTNGAAYLLAFLTGSLGVLSYVYSRANLRGLEVRVAAAPVPAAGGGEVLPVELKAASGHGPCGVEILLAGAARAAFVEQVPAGGSVRVDLRLPAEGGRPLRLLLRSAYPLGLMTAERVVNVELNHHVPPPASGALPLPPVEAAAAGKQGTGGASSRPGREGDDFAGVREWQPGDSPRHIDWRAVARGRPLMVKTWGQDQSGAVRLDWDQVSLPPAEKPGQMVRWVQMCEQQGQPYSLRLPGVEIPPSRGDVHARRCLAALAEIHSGGLAGVETDKPLKIPPSHEHRAGVPRGPLALLSAMLLLTTLPLSDLVPMPVIILLFLSLCYRCLFSRPVGGRAVPLLVVLAGVAGVAFIHEDIRSMEAGIAILIVLAGGKVLESRTPHDFQVIAMVGWFLCLCGVISDQSITRSLIMFVSFLVIAGCMVRFRRAVPGLLAPAKLTARLILQTTPLVVFLFLLFPRVSLDNLVRIGTGRTAMTGVTNSLDPGKVLQVARSNETAFRAEFPNGGMPANHERYWRCVVLWACRGLSWDRGSGTGYATPVAGISPQDVRQLITLEPHGQFWLPGLDFPIHGQGGRGGMVLSAERVLNSHEVVRKMRQVEVISRPQLEWGALPDHQRALALQTPPDLSLPLRDLAAQWRGASRSDREVVQAGLNYLRTQGFKYTLEPGSYLGPSALEEFVLRRRLGFCEHFSAAFATLMRAAGVPARVILGYQGGEMSMTETHLIVRQSDAHSWVEVWLDESGWTRVDPTAELAPGRVNLDLQSYLAGGEDALERRRNSLLWRVQLFWDQVNHQWFNVVNFDRETQFGWLQRLGLERLSTAWLFLISFGSVVLVGGVIALWLRRPARDNDPWRRAWGRLCQRLEKRGAPARRANEGPLAYAQRVEAQQPAIMELARLYAAARYGNSPQASIAAFKRAAKELG